MLEEMSAGSFVWLLAASAGIAHGVRRNHVGLFLTSSSNGKAVPHVSVVRRVSPMSAYRCRVGDGNDDP